MKTPTKGRPETCHLTNMNLTFLNVPSDVTNPRVRTMRTETSLLGYICNVCSFYFVSGLPSQCLLIRGI